MKYERARNNSDSALINKVNAPNITSITRNDLSYITYFNYDQKDYNATKCPEPKFTTPGQACKGLILSEDLFDGQHPNEDGPGDVFPYLWQCRHIVLVWKTYTATETLPTIKRIKLFSAKEFVIAALGNNDKSFCGLIPEAKNVYLSCQAQLTLLKH